jgi:ABC-type uncharacterized transport system auxiliary subunit
MNYFTILAMIFSRFQYKASIFGTVLFASALMFSGCLSRAPLHKEMFSFGETESPVASAFVDNHILKIAKLRIDAPFEERSFVYRTGDFSYVRDPYAEFMDSPDAELMATAREWFRNHRVFRGVADSSSALKPDIILEIDVSQLFGDFRQPKHPAAILTMRFVFFEAPNGIPGKMLFQQEYTRNVPLDEPNAAALMKGWNEGLLGILHQVSENFQNRPQPTEALKNGK